MGAVTTTAALSVARTSVLGGRVPTPLGVFVEECDDGTAWRLPRARRGWRIVPQ